MSNLIPSSSRHGTHRSSHLRNVSNSDSDSVQDGRPSTALSDTGTVQHDPLPVKPPTERKCILWVHEENFSKEEVLLNLDLFPDLKVDDLMAIIPLKNDSSLRDFQDKTFAVKRETDALSSTMQRERSSSNPKSPSLVSQTDTRQDIEPGKHYMFLAKCMPNDIKSKQSTLEISISKHIADIFGLKHRSSVLVTTTDHAVSSASHVELSFKDEYLARSDMWRLAVSELSKKTVYRGQKIIFMGSIKAQVSAVYMNGRQVQSAFFSTSTKPVFRSGSARYVLFIQMSREMWDFDSEGSGEIMFNKVVNGFLPALFKKWAALKVKHLVSIVLFTRVEYDTGIATGLASDAQDTAYYTGIQIDENKRPYKDFYRVVVSEMRSGEWTTILYQLKREFRFFRRDISMHRINLVTANGTQVPPLTGNQRGVLGTSIEAEPSLAMHGNVLEAINLAASQFSHDYIDRDLMRTGISIVVITPCPGLFEVDYETLRMTTESLIGNGIGIDLVCLPKMPLHSVPLFRYRNPQYTSYQDALHFRSFRSQDSTPRQHGSVFGGSFSSLNQSLSPTKTLRAEPTSHGDPAATNHNPPGKWSYAIPHWLDVSFWTGASQDISLTRLSPKVHRKQFKKMLANQGEDFAIRCKMYEFEMYNVGEESISITSILQEPLLSQLIREARTISTLKSIPQELFRTIRRLRPHLGLSEFMSNSSKASVERKCSKVDKKVLQCFDAYDRAKSEFSEDHARKQQRDESKKYGRHGSPESTRLSAENLKQLSSSYTNDMRRHTDKGPSSKTTPSRGKKDLEESDLETTPRKGSMTVKPRPTLGKTPNGGRQISLGKLGFNIATPKAAIAEIQIENASAAKPISNNQDPKTTSSGMANHLLQSANTQLGDRPSSSRSDKPSIKSNATAVEKSVVDSWDSPKASSAQPMTIRSALESMDSKNQFRSRSVLGSLYETAEQTLDGEDLRHMASSRTDDNQRLFYSKLLAGSVPELPAVLSPTTAMAPWLSVLNPSNPSVDDQMGPGQYRRWQHVFPKPIVTKTMKWKSLCSPAAVPLTTEFFPTKQQLDTEYQQKPYNIAQIAEEELSEKPANREEFLRELIGLRLSQGFQIVIGPAVAEAFGQKSLRIANVFDPDTIAEDGSSVFMSMGNVIHQLSCVNGTEVEVNMFIRKPMATTPASPGTVLPSLYNPAIRTTLAGKYVSRKVLLGRPKEEYNWNYVDAFIAGFDEEMTDTLRFWRARFVLIPVERPTRAQKPHGEDNEEEIRLEGIQKLTKMWQRYRVPNASEKRFLGSDRRKNKDQNPLDIVYKTEDPSVVITAELETLPLVETGDQAVRKSQLLEIERFRRTKLEIAQLAEAIQAPIEKGGVRMQNRRWHFRLHYNCFIGSDMTTWLIENFEDIETREEAVEFGNKLMAKDDTKQRDSKEKDIGIFVHVEKRHAFRDGQYFYQVTGEFAKQRPESRSGWFSSKRRETSVPPTPSTEGMARDSPRIERSRDDKSTDSDGTATPVTGKRPKVALSKMMKYDVDHRKRSYRPERINLHYDRLHNPDNCYHIRIDWIGVTAKLIEDAIESWATTAERYGLRLVEAPIGEACAITDVHPFRSPYTIELAAQPPDQQPKTYFDINSFAPQFQSSPANRHFYQKAIMKKFNFVLDIEAAKNFPSNVDVSYSWGKPDFKYSQYIHRSGVVLAQITDDGSFLLLANRLYNNRTMAARELDRYLKFDHSDNRNTNTNTRIPHQPIVHAPTPFHFPRYPHPDRTSPVNSPLLRAASTNMNAIITSPRLRATADVLGPHQHGPRQAAAITPEIIKNELESFCKNASALEAFYKEVYEKSTAGPSATPPSFRSPLAWIGVADANIPTLGLPPTLLGRDVSPAPMRAGMPFLGRRMSAQVGVSGASPGPGAGFGGEREGRGGVRDG